MLVRLTRLSRVRAPQACGNWQWPFRLLLVKEGFEPDLLAGATATYRVRGPLPEPGGNVAYHCCVEFTTVGGRSYAVELSELNAP